MDKLTLSSCIAIYADNGRIWIRVIEKDGCNYEAELGKAKAIELAAWLSAHTPNAALRGGEAVPSNRVVGDSV